MSIEVILGTAFVVSGISLIFFIKYLSKDLGKGKMKLTKEQKAMKAMGAKI